MTDSLVIVLLFTVLLQNKTHRHKIGLRERHVNFLPPSNFNESHVNLLEEKNARLSCENPRQVSVHSRNTCDSH